MAGVLGGGAAKVKKKIRDIQRLLRKDNLPADVRHENERALKALQVDLDNTQARLRAAKNAKKYHMVRFFERKKALRKLKQARKALAEAEEAGVKKDIKKARKVVRHCEVDVAYVILYPKEKKYIALYPNSDVDMSDPNVKKGVQQSDERRLEFKKHVELLIDEDKLPFTFEAALTGKNIVVEQEHHTTTEIDAPQQEPQNDEDDFFE